MCLKKSKWANSSCVETECVRTKPLRKARTKSKIIIKKMLLLLTTIKVGKIIQQIGNEKGLR